MIKSTIEKLKRQRCKIQKLDPYNLQSSTFLGLEDDYFIIDLIEKININLSNIKLFEDALKEFDIAYKIVGQIDVHLLKCRHNVFKDGYLIEHCEHNTNLLTFHNCLKIIDELRKTSYNLLHGGDIKILINDKIMELDGVNLCDHKLDPHNYFHCDDYEKIVHTLNHHTIPHIKKAIAYLFNQIQFIQNNIELYKNNNETLITSVCNWKCNKINVIDSEIDLLDC